MKIIVGLTFATIISLCFCQLDIRDDNDSNGIIFTPITKAYIPINSKYLIFDFDISILDYVEKMLPDLRKCSVQSDMIQNLEIQFYFAKFHWSIPFKNVTHYKYIDISNEITNHIKNLTLDWAP